AQEASTVETGPGRPDAGGDVVNTMAPTEGTLDPSLRRTGDKLLDTMNARFFVVQEGGKSFVGTFENDRGRQTLLLLRFTDFKNLHMHKRVDIGDKTMPLGTWWLQQSKRRQYEGLTFHPGNNARVIKGKLNLWRGWAFQPRKGDWSKLRR